MSVIISYSSLDKVAALSIRHALVANDVPVWIDRIDIPPGQNWQMCIDEAIRGCTHMVLLLSPNSMASPEVEAEWNLAKELKKPIIPILMAETTVPFRLHTLQHINLSEFGFENAIKRLCIALPSQPLPRHWVLDESGDTGATPGQILPRAVGYARIAVPTSTGEMMTVCIRPQAYPTLQDLLDDLYTNYLQKIFEPYTYGSKWILGTRGVLIAPPRWIAQPDTSVHRLDPFWGVNTYPSQVRLLPDTWWMVKAPVSWLGSNHLYAVLANDEALFHLISINLWFAHLWGRSWESACDLLI